MSLMVNKSRMKFYRPNLKDAAVQVSEESHDAVSLKFDE